MVFRQTGSTARAKRFNKGVA
ncbi:MAG: hypothetical protein K0R99_5040, partial [Microbacterium sp.]|nr:hypothetical protein [Microbacterium sp.]